MAQALRQQTTQTSNSTGPWCSNFFYFYDIIIEESKLRATYLTLKKLSVKRGGVGALSNQCSAICPL